MKTKLNNIFILCIPFIIFLTFILGRELFILNLASKNKYIKSVTKARFGEVECLIMGDSHTNDLFGRGFVECDSLAIGGSSIYMIDQLVRSVISKNHVTKIILGIGPHYFSNYRRTNKSENFKNFAEYFKNDLNLLGSNPVIREMTPSFSSFFQKKKSKKVKKHWDQLSSDEKIKKLNKRITRHTPPHNFLDSEFAKTYISLIRDLHKEGINVCLVRPPLSQAYQEEMKKILNLNEWEKLISTLRPFISRYISYEEYDIDLEDKYFKNQDHLASQYQKEFSQKYFNLCFN